jgi:hypothetical protein
VARWNSVDGKPQSKRYAIAVYGEEKAFKLACEHREVMIQSLNSQGAGYTEDHGKRGSH